MKIKAILFLSLLSAAGVSQAGTFDQYGDVQVNPSGDAFRLTSDPAGAGYAGLYYTPSSPMTLNSLTNVSADYSFLQGHFGLGSPRFSVILNSDDNNDGYDDEFFVYWGTGPNYTDTPSAGFHNTGNLLASSDNRFDSTQLSGGSYGDNSSHVYSAYGNRQVLYVDVDLDGGTASNVQQMDVKNFTVNGEVQAVPEPATVAALGLGALFLVRRKRRS